VLDPRFIERFGTRWQDAVNRQAIAEIVALCAEDINILDPNLAETESGPAALRAFFERIWRAFPDLRFTRPDAAYLLSDDGVIAVARWAAVGTMTGRLDPPGYRATNSTVRFHGVDLWQFRGELLSDWEGIYDTTAIGRQIAALPPIGSGALREADLRAKFVDPPR
jgi:ketosteroid isomerase-like protein